MGFRGRIWIGYMLETCRVGSGSVRWVILLSCVAWVASTYWVAVHMGCVSL